MAFESLGLTRRQAVFAVIDPEPIVAYAGVLAAAEAPSDGPPKDRASMAPRNRAADQNYYSELRLAEQKKRVEQNVEQNRTLSALVDSCEAAGVDPRKVDTILANEDMGDGEKIWALAAKRRSRLNHVRIAAAKRRRTTDSTSQAGGDSKQPLQQQPLQQQQQQPQPLQPQPLQQQPETDEETVAFGEDTANLADFYPVDDAAPTQELRQPTDQTLGGITFCLRQEARHKLELEEKQDENQKELKEQQDKIDSLKKMGRQLLAKNRDKDAVLSQLQVDLRKAKEQIVSMQFLNTQLEASLN